VNLNRYVGNGATNATDPSGLQAPISVGIGLRDDSLRQEQLTEFSRIHRQKIASLQASHKRYAYYDSMNLDYVFSLLYRAPKHLKRVRRKDYGEGFADSGEYLCGSRTLILSSGSKLEDFSTDIWVHESIHVVDDQFKWYPHRYFDLSDVPESLENAEALAYATVELIGVGHRTLTKELQQFEKGLDDYHEFGIENQLQRDWELAWHDYLSMTNMDDVVTWGSWTGNRYVRPLTPRDFHLAFYHLKIRVNMAELTRVYNTLLKKRGYDCKLKVPDPYSSGYLTKRIIK